MTIRDLARKFLSEKATTKWADAKKSAVFEFAEWIYLFRSQFSKYRRFRFGFFESIRWATWQADRISASGRSFRKWMEEEETRKILEWLE